MAINEKAVYAACQNGDTEIIKNLLDSEGYKNTNQISTSRMLLTANDYNQLGIIKCILESNEARKKIDPLDVIKELVKTSAKKGYLGITKYLLEQPEVINNKKTEVPVSAALNAINYGKLDTLEYILDNFHDNTVLNRSLKIGTLLSEACKDGELEIVKYLLDKTKVNIHFNDDLCFKSSYDEDQFEVLRYFIFDLDLEKTGIIKDYMNQIFKPEVGNMFELRDLNKSLNQELTQKSSVNKRAKI
jgi:hypothetical protein